LETLHALLCRATHATRLVQEPTTTIGVSAEERT